MPEPGAIASLVDALVLEALADAAISLDEAVRTTSAGAVVGPARSRFLQDWVGGLADFRAELDALGPSAAKSAVQDAARRLERRWHDAIDAGHTDAWRLGYRFRGVDAPREATATLRQAIEGQRAFATRYAADLVAGVADRKGAMGPGARGAMYAQSIEGSFHRGAAEAGPPGEQIFWRLGAAEHCVWTPDALVLTRRGEVPICEVVVGDEVFTHRARWRRVLATHMNPIEATLSSADAFVVRTRSGGEVGLTSDHRVWTLDGWVPACLLADAGAHVLESVHASALRQMFGEAALRGPYDDLPQVPTDLQLWPAEGASVEDVHGMHRADAVGGQRAPDAGSGVPRAMVGSDASARPAHADHVRGSVGDELQSATPAGWPCLRDLLGGRRPAAHDLPVPVAVGAGERGHPGRDGAAPQERGPDGRRSRESGTAAGSGAQAAPSPDGGRLGLEQAGTVRYLRAPVRGSTPQGVQDRKALLQPGLPGCLAQRPEPGSTGHEDVQRVPGDVRGGAERGCDEGHLLAALCGDAAPEATGGVAVGVGQLNAGTIVYDLTVDEDHSFVVEGVVIANCHECPALATNSPYTKETLGQTPKSGATPCRSNCKCFLEFRAAPKGAKARVAPDRRPFDQAVTDPLPAPSGFRRPTADEANVLRDLEMRMNHARRQIAATRGTPAQRVWIQTRRDLNRQIVDFNEARGTHWTPRFRVSEVLNSADVELPDIDNVLTMRGIDGATVHRAAAREIVRQLADAVDDMGALLDSLPPDAPAVPNLAAELRRLGAPPEEVGARSPRAPRREDAPVRAALREDLERVPVPESVAVLNVVARSGRQALLAHVEAIRTLVEDGPFAVEVGPADEDWAPLVLGSGSWIRGTVAETDRFLGAWRTRARAAVLMEAPWQLNA